MARSQGGGELAGVGVEEEAPAVGNGASHAVPVLEAVAELAEGVNVAKKGSARAEGGAGAEIFVRLGASAAVELNDGQRVESRWV